MPAGPVRQVILPAARPAGCFPCRTGPAGRYSQFSGAPPHTTSVARLPGRNSGQKAQKGPQKKKFLAEFWLILPKTGRKGAAENFQKNVSNQRSILSVYGPWTAAAVSTAVTYYDITHL